MRKQPQETIATCMAAARELDAGCEMASYVAALMPVAAVARIDPRPFAQLWNALLCVCERAGASDIY
jgi:hypothetical protein